ncbi:MAG: sigma 54-interacting transcriptional regulator, partial [Planctomycetota bacterium]|nr:sigma 54-interacting transcriptional regulator [Planctomycetota bacterium]
MCVPLKVRDEVIGAVYVDGRGMSSFAPEDLDYLVCFAQLAAIAVDNARLLSSLRDENRSLRREVETQLGLSGVIGRSPAMKKLTDLLGKIARSSASVLIEGETGTGKSVIARAVHYASNRKSRPFVTVDCGALPETLLESELFGHKRGAFSGALHDRVGLVEEAEGGTLFLDEITNTSTDLQTKLLRVLQEGEVRRVGENQPRKVDVRIIAATNTDLEEAVRKGTFREDLFYRLNVFSVEIPPLRDRREDIPLLATHFLSRSRQRLEKEVTGIAEDALRLLYDLPWNGNVRELENLIEKALILTDDDVLTADFLATLLPAAAPLSGTDSREAADRPRQHVPIAVPPLDAASLEEFDRHWHDAERRYLLDVVEQAGWNLSAAARLAGVRNRNTLVSRLKKHDIRRPETPRRSGRS